MKLQSKLALFNTISKVLIFSAFALLLPMIIGKVAYDHTDKRLMMMKGNVLHLIDTVGIETFQAEQDSGFGSYNLLKEEFISIEPYLGKHTYTLINNNKRNIEGEIVDYRVLSYTFIRNNKYYLLEIGRSLNTIQELDITLKKFALYIMLIIIIATTATDIGFTKYLLTPFRKIIERKLKTTEHPEHFNFSTIKTSTTDFQYLDKSINEMMYKINKAFLAEKQFIANASHELLTPISILQNRFENIIADRSTPDELAVKLIESQKTLSRLDKIIKTLLLISKIENNQYLKKETCSIKELLTEVGKEIEDRLVEKSIQLNFILHSNFVITNCNKSLLFTLFFNLVNNAVKYNVVNGTITIISNSENESKWIEITDTGIGISKENCNSIFDPFKKIKNSTNVEGYGLGLPIVKTIADFHNAKIVVKSEPGLGSTFKIIF